MSCSMWFLQLKNGIASTHSHQIEKARAHIAELYDLNKIRDDAERLTVIEKLLDHDNFYMRDTDRDLPSKVSGERSHHGDTGLQRG